MIPRFKRDEARKHIEAIFGKEFDGLIELAWSHHEKDKKGRYPINRARLFDARNIEALLDKADLVNCVPMQSVFISALTRRPDTPRRNDEFERCGKEHALAAHALFNDIDDKGAAERARDRWTKSKCPPNVVVVTSRMEKDGPWLKVQPWWKLVEPLTDLDALEEANKALIATFGSDQLVFNRDRVMRLGGSISWPIKGGNRIDQQTEVNHYGDRRLYRLDEILSEFGQPSGALFVSHALPTPVASQPVAVTTPAAEWGAVAAPPAPTLTAADFGPSPTPTAPALPSALYGFDGRLKHDVAIEILQTTRDGGLWRDTLNRLVLSMLWRDTPQKISKLARSFTSPNSKWTDADTLADIDEAVRTAVKRHGPLPWKHEPKFDAATGEVLAPGQEPTPPLVATRLGRIDPRALPRRGWMLGERLIKKFVTVTVAPPGVGKSTLTMQEMIAVALNDSRLTGDTVRVSGPTWIYNNEDPLDELHRRVAAICLHYELDPEIVGERVFLNSGRTRRLIVARETDGAVVQTPDVEALTEQIRANGIVALTIDPFVRVHRVSENANEQIDMVADLFSQIADRTDCAINLVHHTRKAGPGATGNVPGDMETARGASSLTGAARVAHTLLTMTEKDAGELGVDPDERRWYVRRDDAKASMSPPANGAVWFRRVSVELPNAGEGLGLSPDSVGVLERWTPPQPDAATLEDAANELRIMVLDAMEASGETTVADVARHMAAQQGGNYRTWSRRITQAVNLANNGTDHDHQGERVRLWRREMGRNRSDELTRQVIP